MKVEVKEVEKKFEPIELVITIDSENERLALIDICGYNIAIPNMVAYKNKEFIKDFLDQLRDNLLRV
jgi:hypothetical protein